jgi:hypothetical protein
MKSGGESVSLLGVTRVGEVCPDQTKLVVQGVIGIALESTPRHFVLGAQPDWRISRIRLSEKAHASPYRPFSL